MGLLELWTSDKPRFDAYHVRQIVSFAGNGILADGSITSQEFQQLLGHLGSSKLVQYVDHCLSNKFDQSGFVLQDLVNELGRRLDFEVTNGRYRGTRSHIGFDGNWISPEGHTLVVEVKTTDAYRINLDTLINYRRELQRTAEILEPSSVLIVVGRQDTGDMEAQIRGSRHAWDIRLLSASSLAKLVRLKEASDETTAAQIRNLLVPHEYTRLDQLVDTLFDTAEDVRTPVEDSATVESADEDGGPPTNAQERTDSQVLDFIRDLAVSTFSFNKNQNIIKKSKAQFWSSDRSIRVCCTVSKFYERNNQYWYAYHPEWDEFLSGGDAGYLILGCVGATFAFAIPREFMAKNLVTLSRSERPSGKMYWHIHLAELDNGHFAIRQRGRGNKLNVDEFRFELPDEVHEAVG